MYKFCPFCLSNGIYVENDVCTKCKKEIKGNIKEYVDNSVWTSIGFVGERNSGKTTFIASLFYIMFNRKDFDAIAYSSLNNTDFTVEENINLLREKKLPDATNNNFTQETIIKISFNDTENSVKEFLNRQSFIKKSYVIPMVDIAGEVLEKASENSHPQKDKVMRSETIFWLIDLTKKDLRFVNIVDRYINNRNILKDKERFEKQNVIVLVTKFDSLLNRINNQEISKWLNNGSLKDRINLLTKEDMNVYKKISNIMKNFLKHEGFANTIANLENNFKNVYYLPISSLGSNPISTLDSNQNKKQMLLHFDEKSPKGVIDPLILALYFAKDGRSNFKMLYKKLIKILFGGKK